MTKLILQAIHPVFSLPEPDKGVGRIGPEVESPLGHRIRQGE
jgi:hypothetical protein